MTTVYDVADLAGVSTATVSRVIHGSPLVHPDTQQRVRAAIDQLGFVPDRSAQGLSRRRKDIIGLAALERGTDEMDIEQAGRLVPGDIAVTGFDDIYASRIVTPAVTTVSQPLRDLGRKAAARLRARIEDRGLPPRAEILSTHLVIRASCGCPQR